MSKTDDAYIARENRRMDDDKGDWLHECQRDKRLDRIAELEAENERLQQQWGESDKAWLAARQENARQQVRAEKAEAERDRLRELGRGLLIAVLDVYPTVRFITVAGTGVHINVEEARAALEEQSL